MIAFSGFKTSKIFLLVIEYKNASSSFECFIFSFVQLHLVNPPKISLFLVLTTNNVAPLKLHFSLKSLHVLPSLVAVYNNSELFKSIFFNKEVKINAESSLFVIILEFLK